MKSERVLVTGGAGYVGSVLVPYLLASGYQVRVLDSLMHGIGGLLEQFNSDDFEFVKGDVRDASAVKKAAEDVDYVVHLAAMVGYPICKQNPDEAMAVNAGGTQVVASEVPKKVPIIFASTGSCYGNLEEVCKEDLPLQPKTLYAKSKMLAEQHLQKRGNFVIYRFATGYGISPRLRLDLMINDFVYKAVKEKNLVVYERQFQRTFIHVCDMARAFYYAVESFDRVKDEVYNVGSEGMNLTKEYIARLIREKTPYYLHFADFGKDEDVRNYEVSYAKINNAGWETIISLERGVEQLIKLFRVFEMPKMYSNV